jgi:nitrogen fixation protein NifU and related proteins
MALSEKVTELAAGPTNEGALDKEDPSVGTGVAGAGCGDVIRLQVRVNDAGVVEDAKFKAYGCGSLIASSQVATEWMKGKTVDAAQGLKAADIEKELALPPVKVTCTVLAEDAVKAAIADYRRKREARGK